MSTRATILVKDDKFKEQSYVYHHCDGYPSGIGVDLKKFLAGLKEWEWDVDTIVTKLIKNTNINDDGYEWTSCVHSDEEYLYLIDCVERTIKCYKVWKFGYTEATASIIGDEEYEVPIE